MTLPVVFTANGAQGYNLTNSLRFRSSASAYLNRTFSTGNRLLFTFSAWVKRGSLTGNQNIFGPNTSTAGSGTYGVLRFVDGNLEAFDYTNGTNNWYLSTTPVYRDPSAWYHIVMAYDSAQATSSNRVKLYVNGVQVTALGTAIYPSLSYQGQWNNNLTHYLGTAQIGSSNQYFDGYMAEVNFVDGQALTPSSFGQTDSATGVWQPAKYTGTYGTNGFYLPFTDTTSTTTISEDFSGNNNDWTSNNISLTSGVTYDSMTDVPTLTDTDTANYAVMNPLTTGTQTTLSGANLNLSQPSGSSVGNSRSSFAMLTGKWYFETTLTANSSGIYPQLGIMTARDGSRPNNDYPQAGYSTSSLDPTLSVIYMADGTKQTNGSASSYGSSFTNGDVIGIAIDSDNGAIYFAKNGTWQNSGVPTSGSSKTGAALTWTGGTVEHVYSVAGYNNTAEAVNFGQRPFAYTPPTGFVALNTFNLPTPTIGATASSQANKYMDATLYTGTGASLSVTNAGSFQPDMVWIKSRSAATDNKLTDAVRGTTKGLISNTTGAETTDTNGLTAFNSNGFTVGTDTVYNNNTATYVAWQWKANGSGSSNTDGSITSTVSANTTAGFSIVTYTGNATSGATVGHGLGVAPSMVIVKSRSAANNWCVYHISIGNQYATLLNTTAGSYSNSNYWNNTSPTSTLFSLGNGNDTNQSSATFVAYCFAQVAGYSAFGSYTGNGSTDGPFVYTGFRPSFVLVKRYDNTGNWFIWDDARNTYNTVNNQIYPDSSSAEQVQDGLDFVSNGFKIRFSSTFTDRNANGGTYIYMAFAENPFKYSLAR